MASYLRPRRGKEATAKSQNIVLKRGEIFFETPAGGVGTGIGRLKMGDGSTAYASLPYFLKQLDLNDNNTKCAFTNATAATDKANNSTYLNNIAPGNSLKTLFQNIKQLLLNYNSQLTSLNNDLAGKQAKGSYAAANHNHDSAYQAKGSYATSSHTHTFASLTSKPTTLSGYGITDAANSYRISQCRIRAGKITTKTAAGDNISLFSDAQMNKIFGVTNCSNGNVCMVLANADSGQLSAHVDGCSYVNGGWRAVLDRNVNANINVTLTYIAAYIG